jgi:hypothetical protein
LRLKGKVNAKRAQKNGGKQFVRSAYLFVVVGKKISAEGCGF